MPIQSQIMPIRSYIMPMQSYIIMTLISLPNLQQEVVVPCVFLLSSTVSLSSVLWLLMPYSPTCLLVPPSPLSSLSLSSVSSLWSDVKQFQSICTNLNYGLGQKLELTISYASVSASCIVYRIYIHHECMHRECQQQFTPSGYWVIHQRLGWLLSMLWCLATVHCLCYVV